MAAGTQVCSFQHNKLSTPTTNCRPPSVNFLMNLNLQQYWTMWSYPPSFAEVPRTSATNMNQNLGGSEKRFRCQWACFKLFKFHLLNGPIQSQNVIQMHLKNMLFGGVNTMQNAQFTSHSRLYMGECSLPKEGTDLTTWKSDPLMSAEPTQEQLCGGGCSPHGDECYECYESDDSDSECSFDSEGRQGYFVHQCLPGAFDSH